MKRFCLFVLIFLGVLLQLQGESFRFNFAEGQKYKMLTEVKEKVYVNDVLSHTALLLNKIAFEVLKVDKGAGLIRGVFQVSEMEGSTLYRLRDEEFLAEYWRSPLGEYKPSKREQLMPLTRNIPLFPEKEIEPGATWKAMGEEVHDFRPFGIDVPIHIPVEVNYVFVSVEKSEKGKIAKINLKYEFNYPLKDLLKIPGSHPVLVIGRVDQNYYWNLDRGHVEHYEDSFDVLYHFNDYRAYEFVGTSAGRLVEMQEMDKKKLAEEIQNTIDQQGLKDTSVKEEDTGVTITFENIQFLPESSVLVAEEKEKLNKISSILKKYPERDILISGHTARFGTEESSQLLSEERAKSVGEYLLSLGIRRPDQLIYRGFGSRKPLGDNSTEEGAQKNRRVEMTILEN
ncbi:MAG: OmpA family protein [Spirochaetales bacterium]|nr:OmpA family protein [Spirochaetales bacterium]